MHQALSAMPLIAARTTIARRVALPHQIDTEPIKKLQKINGDKANLGRYAY
ncbi:MAG: hypothetical protein ACYCZQ_10850 [Burkholderiales bacterium]